MERLGGPMIDPSHVKVLRRVCATLTDTNINWVVTGSLSFALQGIPVEVHDIDIQTDRAGAYKIEQHFSEYVTRPVRLSTGDRIRSHFGAFVIEGITIEIMGDVQKQNPSGTWDRPVNLALHKKTIEMEGIRVPVLSLDYECQAYEKLERSGMANHLKKWLSRSHGSSADTSSRPASDIEIRPARECDTDDIYETLRASFEPYRRDYTDEAYEATVIVPDEIRRRINSHDTEVLSALSDGRVVGTATINAEGQSMYIRSMAVRPGYQGKGIGRLLLEEISKLAIERGSTKLSLECYEPLDKAQALYERFGFRGTGNKRNYHCITIFEMLKEIANEGKADE